MTKEEIQVIIKGNAAGAKAAFSQTQAAGQKFADNTIGQFRAVSGAVLNLQNLLLGGAIVGGINKLTSKGDDIDKLSQRMTISAEEFQVLAHAIKLGGGEVSQLQTTFKSLTSVIFDARSGTKEATDVLDALGITLEDLDGKTPHEMFLTTFRALGDIEDQAARSALAQDLYGRSGLNLLPVLNSTGGELDVLADKMRRNGQLLDKEQIEKSAEFKDSLTELNAAITAAMFDALEEQIGDATAAINNLVESGQIKEWGEDLAKAVEIVYDRLKGLTEWIQDNRELLITLGLSWGAYRTIVALHSGIQLLTAGVTFLATVTRIETAAELEAAAAKGVNTAATITLTQATATLAGVLGTVAAVGATAFIGWKIGTLIGEVTGLHDAIVNLLTEDLDMAVNSPEAEETMRQSIWTQKYGSLKDRNRQGQTYEEAQAAIKERDAARQAEKPAAKAKRGQGGKLTAEQIKAREKAEKAAAKAAEKAAKEMAKLREKETAAVKALDKAKADHAKQAERQTELDAIRKRIETLREEQATLQENARVARDKADKDTKAAEDNWKTVARRGKTPAGELAQQRREAREAARIKKREDRNEAKAEEDLEKAKNRRDKGFRLTTRQKELIAADDKREAAKAAADVAAGEEAKVKAQEEAIAKAQEEAAKAQKKFAEQDYQAGVDAQLEKLTAIRKAIEALKLKTSVSNDITVVVKKDDDEEQNTDTGNNQQEQGTVEGAAPTETSPASPGKSTDTGNNQQEQGTVEGATPTETSPDSPVKTAAPTNGYATKEEADLADSIANAMFGKAPATAPAPGPVPIMPQAPISPTTTHLPQPPGIMASLPPAPSIADAAIDYSDVLAQIAKNTDGLVPAIKAIETGMDY